MTVNGVQLVRSRRADDAVALEDQLPDGITFSLWNAPSNVPVALARVQEYRSVNRAIKDVPGPPFELKTAHAGKATPRADLRRGYLTNIISIADASSSSNISSLNNRLNAFLTASTPFPVELWDLIWRMPRENAGWGDE